MSRYDVTSVTIEGTDDYNGKPVKIVLHGTGVLHLVDALKKTDGSKAYHQDGRGAGLSMTVTSEEITPA